LDHLVQGFYQGFELGPAEELDFIEQQDDSTLTLMGGRAQGKEHVSQVHRQVGMVGEAFRRIDIQSCRQRARRVQVDREGLENRRRMTEAIRPACLWRQFQQGRAQPTLDVTAEVGIVVLADLELDHNPFALKSLHTELTKQHGLADTS